MDKLPTEVKRDNLHGYVKKKNGRCMVNSRLESAEERSSIYSTTFKIEPREVREAVQPGELVKLIFTVVEGESKPNPFNGERMYAHSMSERLWVKVVWRSDGCIKVGKDGELEPCDGEAAHTAFDLEDGRRFHVQHTTPPSGSPVFLGVVHSSPAILKDIIPSDSILFSPEHICEISHLTKENK